VPPGDHADRAHYHDTYELLVVRSGTGTLASAGRNISVTPGTSVLVAPGLVHSHAGLSGIEAWSVHFRTADVDLMLLLVDSLDWPRWVMTGPDYAMLWNALLVIPMLSIGLQYANRTLIAGGLVLAASLVAPRVDPWRIDLYLALGMFLGCAVPGIIFGLRRRG
jgi:hypothetical protein